MKPLFLFAVAYIGGIAFSSFVPVPTFFWFLLLAGAVVCLGMCWRFPRAAFVGVFFIGCLLGVARYNQAVARSISLAATFDASIEKGGQWVMFGQIVREPEERRGSMRLVFKPDPPAGEASKQEGFVLLVTDLFGGYKYGDRLSVKGKLEKPATFEDFDYRAYLAKEDIYAIAYRPEISRMQYATPKPLEKVFVALFAWKERWKNMVRGSFSPPESGILGATLLADKAAWSDEFLAKLNRTGLTHVTAISGQHITIFSSLLLPLLLGLGLWKKHAIVLVLVFVVFFITATGFEASAIRAGIMGTLGILGTLAGRRNDSIRALAFAGAAMLVINPLLLSRDVGFQLSFLAVLGIIWCYPFFRHVLAWLPETLGIRDAGAMTIAAQLLTFPILISNFGSVSIVSPITNILIAPIVSLLIGGGLIFLAAGTLFGAVGIFIFSMPLAFLLSYFSLVVELFSRLPFAAISVGSAASWVSLILFVPAVALAWRLKTKPEYVIY